MKSNNNQDVLIGKKDNLDSNFLKAAKITPKDDAFHGSMNLFDIEWWYFDASFDNNYSLHIGIRLFHIGKSGFVRPHIEIYHKGKLVNHALKTIIFRDFETSSDIPLIKLYGKTVVEFDQDHYKKTGEWRYKTNLQINGDQIDLTFIGLTKGWKIETDENSWAVALPKAKVEGTLTIKGKQIKVQGVGYHDHNWDYTIATMLKNIGWYWGKVNGKDIDITWAKTIAKSKSNLIAVINFKNEFFTVDPKNISLTLNKFVLDHLRWIPTEFNLHIDGFDSNLNKISAKVKMTAETIQHSRIFNTQYWRYHVKTTGEISVDQSKETIRDNVHMIEYLCFKSQGKKQ